MRTQLLGNSLTGNFSLARSFAVMIQVSAPVSTFRRSGYLSLSLTFAKTLETAAGDLSLMETLSMDLVEIDPMSLSVSVSSNDCDTSWTFFFLDRQTLVKWPDLPHE